MSIYFIQFFFDRSLFCISLGYSIFYCKNYNFKQQKMMSFFILIYILVQICHSKMEFNHEMINPNFSSTYKYSSIHVNNGNLVTLSTNSGIQYVYSSTSLQKNLQLNLTCSGEVRISSFTSVDNFTPVILYFEENNVILLDKFLNSLAQNLDFSNYNGNLQIKDACFGKTNSQIFIYGELSNTSDQVFILFNGTTTPTISKIINISSSSSLDKLVCQDGRIYISFDTYFRIYSMDSSFTQLLIVQFPISYGIQFLDFHVTQGIILYSYGAQITILNSTNFEILANYTHDKFISGAKVAGKYVLWVDGLQVIQFDYQVGSIISGILIPTFQVYTLEYLPSNNILVFNQPSYASSASIFFYNFSSTYDSNSSNCLRTYAYSAAEFLCIKNEIQSNSSSNTSNTSTNLPSNLTNSTNLTNQTNLTNITNPVQNSSIANNSSLNSSVITTTNISLTNGNFNTSFDDDEYSIDTLIRQYFIYLNKTYGLSLTNGASSLLILSSFKISPQFLFSLVIIFDDLWLYQFHNKSYPHSVKIIFENVNVIETNRLNVWFLQLIQILNTPTTFAVQNNNNMQKYLSISSLEQSDVFFTRSLIQNYRNNILTTFIIFLVLRLLRSVLFMVRFKFKIFSKIYRFVNRISQWWLFVSSIIQILAAKITFDFGVQILIPSYINLLDKINIFISLIVFFIILIYSLSFYPLVFCSISKTFARQLLNPCRYQLKSFFFQPTLTLLRAILRSFAHSLFLRQYRQQIFFLMMIDFLSIMVCFKMRGYFKNTLNFCLYTLYMVFLAIFDIFFYFQTAHLMPKGVKRQLFGTIVILGLFIISILVSLIILVKSIIKIIKGCKKSKIKDESRKSKEAPKLSFKKQTLSCNIIPEKKLSLTETQEPKQTKQVNEEIQQQIQRKYQKKGKKHYKTKRKSKYKKNCLSSSAQIKDKQLCKIKNIFVVKILEDINQECEIEQPQIILKKNSSNKA